MTMPGRSYDAGDTYPGVSELHRRVGRLEEQLRTLLICLLLVMAAVAVVVAASA